MFERFTDRARRALVHGQDEAKVLRHNFIGTEHILLGLAVEGDGVAGVVLREFGITADIVREEIRERVPSGGSSLYLEDVEALAALGIDLAAVKGRLEDNFGEGALELPDAPPPPFTPKAKLALERAYGASLELLHNYIGTEHVLLGVLAIDDGVAAEVVGAVVHVEDVRARTLRAIADYTKDDPRPEVNLDVLYLGWLDLARIATPGPPTAPGPKPPQNGDPARLRDAYVNGRALLFDLRHAEELMGQFVTALRGFAAGVGGEIVLLESGIYLVKDPTSRLTPDQRRQILDSLVPTPA